MRPWVVVAIVSVATATLACATPRLHNVTRMLPSPSGTPMAQLWTDPVDLAERDLLWGPGRAAAAPSSHAPYRVIERDTTGYSRGYDVTGPDGRTWDIKVGKEARPEIVVSRILWALGYSQPETYYLEGWQLVGSWSFEGEPARFRLESDHESDGEWSWRENPFANSAPLRGLIALNVLLGNNDFKTSNNRVYVMTDRRAEPSRRYVVQDIGFALGKPRGFPFFIGTRNDVDDFEATRLIKKVNAGSVELDFRGLHRDVMEQVRISDLVWACALMNRLSDAQLDDAFEAAAYDPATRERFVRKIRDKLQEGLALDAGPAGGGA